MSRILKAATVAMLVSGVAAVAFTSAPASAGPAPIAKIKVKHAILDWTPKHAAAGASLQPRAAVGGKIQTFSATVHDGASTFRYTMVGKNPFVPQAAPSTTVNTTLVPVIIKFSNGDAWDPTVLDGCDTKNAVTRTRNSPIFSAQHWKFGPTAVGTGQYVDAFQRGEFYSQTKPSGINPGYHVELALRVRAPLIVHVPTTKAAESSTVCGTHKLGAMDIGVLDTAVERYITDTLGPAATTTFPLFLLDNFVEFEGDPGACCVLGYHNAMLNAGRLQTYGVATYDNTGDFSGSADTAVLSHEVGEWMNDPFVNNATLPWGNTGQVAGCQANLEVGDPLSGTAITDTVHGKQYHLQ